jgi:hypothetical protein
MTRIDSFYRLVAIVLLVATCVFGQATSSLTGTVSDPSGAVIPGSTLKIENAQQGLTRQATSDPQGRYAFLQVPPGTYKITAKAAGFADVIVHDYRLLVNAPSTLNLKFEKLGAVSEAIAVSAEGVQVNTTDASIGNAISTKPILELPLNARNIVGLLSLQPGVVTTTEGDNLDSRNGAVNGGKSDQANVTLDGVDVNDQIDRYAFTSVLRMTPDAMQEFRVTTLNANADSGRSSGAQVVLVTKGGTNEIHGSLYEYHRNTLTTANSFFNNMTGVDREKLIRNIFGVGVGGPVKRNRLFYFFNYEGRRDAKDGTALRTVPSLDMRQGILHYLTKSGTTATVTPEDIVNQISGSQGVSQAALKVFQSYPTPNDFTTGDGLNQVGYRFKAPTPLTYNTYITRIDAHLDSADKHTVFFRGNLQNDDEQKIPWFPGQASQSVTLRNNKGFAVGLTSVLKPTLVSNLHYGLTRAGADSTGLQTQAMVTFRGIDPLTPTTRNFSAIIPVHTLSEDVNWTHGAHTIQFGGQMRIINNNRRDYQNSFSSASSNSSWLVSSGAGLSSAFSNMATSGITLFRWSMSDVLGLITQGNAQYNYLASGKSIGEGAPVLRDFQAHEYEMYVQDTWKISRTLTATGGIRWTLAPPIHEANGQQVSPNVRIGDWFNMRGGLALAGKSQMEAGRISFSPIGSANSREMYDFHKRDFAPRVSLAWSPQPASGVGKAVLGTGKSVIRAGFGMFYDVFGSGLMRSASATAFGLSTALTNASASTTIATAPRFTSVFELPKGLLLPDPGANFPATYPDAFAITNGVDDTIKSPYNMNLNVSWNRELPGNWSIQTSYVGRLSRRSLVRRDAAMPTSLVDPKSGQNYFQAATILARQSLAGVDVSKVANVPFFENMYSNIAGGGYTSTQWAYQEFQANQLDWTTALYDMDTGAGRGNCVKYGECSDLGPYAMFHPQFSYLSVFSSIAGGSYHGGQVVLSKRFKGDDSININYTLSKSIDLRSNAEREGYSTGVIWNPWNPGLQKGVSDYDTTHYLNAMGTYSLPIGRGKKFLDSIPGWANSIIGGWQLSGSWRWSSGFPESIYETGVWPTNWNNNVWASWTGAPVKTGQSKNAPAISGSSGPNIFPNPAQAVDAFQYVMPGEVGTRNPIRGDGVFNIDTALAKRFVLPGGEGKRTVQFRWETFNLTNTTRFDISSASLDISTAGTFGQYQDQLGSPRVMQFGLRLAF